MFLLGRLFISILPIIYMYLIWQQSAHFDPESVSSLSTVFSETVVLAIGASLELAHLFEFGILFVLIILAFLSNGQLNKWKENVAVIISILYGIIDEIHQIYVPFRSFSLIDLLKDAIGVWLIWFIIHKKYFGTKNSRIGSFLRKLTNFFKKEKKNITF
jgi:VanZ family protein